MNEIEIVDADGRRVEEVPAADADATRRGRRPKMPAEVRDLARRYTVDAIRELGRLATSSPNHAVRIAACRELLDRAWGKAPQPLVGDPEGAPMRIEVIVVDEAIPR